MSIRFGAGIASASPCETLRAPCTSLRRIVVSTLARFRSTVAIGAWLALAGAASASHADAPAAASPAGDALLVVVDPGHGGPPPHDGARGPRGLVEKTIVLQVARRLKASLEATGATVVLTRDNDVDVSLADRARLANEVSADLFVSIHCNSMATQGDRAITRGVEIYFLSPDPTDAEARMLAELENGGPEAVPIPKSADPVSGLLADLALGQARNDSAMLARALHRSIVRGARMASRGVRQAPFLVLSGTKMPSALIEIGFISHPVEGKLLAREKVQQSIADALAAGIREFAAQVLSRRLAPSTPGVRAPAPAPPSGTPAAAAPDAGPRRTVAPPAAPR
jgi:N-acetylmuramoyl-L-alanine amidase